MGMQFDLFDTGGNEILNADSYAEFKRLLTESNCERCALSKSRTNIVVVKDPGRTKTSRAKRSWAAQAGLWTG